MKPKNNFNFRKIELYESFHSLLKGISYTGFIQIFKFTKENFPFILFK